MPQLGVVARPNLERPFVIADLPGLIAGAAQGAGLGIQFLKHVERCRVLLHLVDLSSFEGSARDDFEVVEKELGAFEPELLERQRLLVGSKLDSARDDRRKELRQVAKRCKLPYFEISSATGEGVDALIAELGRRLDEAAP